jgi:O-methyltransferase domain/Dimerisation domain
MAEVTPDPIMRIAMGFMAAKHLFVASEIGLFTGLVQGPATLDQLAATCSIPRRTAGISADAMVSLGLLERDGERYRNSETAAAFLAGQAGLDLRPMLRFWNSISYPGWLALEDAVRAGNGQSKFGQFSTEEQLIFSAGVEAFSAATAAALAANYDFSQHRRLLDIGGGTGSFLLAVLRRHAALRGTLFELPSACEVARRRLASEPERARIDVIEGNLVSDPLPPGHDILLVANTIHVLSATHNIDLLRKLRAQAAQGTQLLLVDLWMDSGHTQPPAAPLMSGEFLIISGEGQAYGEDDAEAWLRETGWRKSERRPLGGPHSVLIAEAV